MLGYLRFDFSAAHNDSFYLIPTISINTWAKGIEINFEFLTYILYVVIRHINEQDYES